MEQMLRLHPVLMMKSEEQTAHLQAWARKQPTPQLGPRPFAETELNGPADVRHLQSVNQAFDATRQAVQDRWANASARGIKSNLATTYELIRRSAAYFGGTEDNVFSRLAKLLLSARSLRNRLAKPGLMKWLLLFAATHGIQFSDDQCRVLRQVRLVAPECQSHFTNPRNVAANYTGAANVGGSTPAGGNVSGAGAPAGGHGMASGGGPSNSPGSGGTPGAGGGSPPGGGSSGSPGNPGGGDSRPGEPPPTIDVSPVPTPPKPAIDPADIAKLRSELRDALRERIIFGFKPPDKPGLPNFKPPDRPGRPSPKLGLALGPGGLRGASSQGEPGPTRR